ncbi:hypothetical protein NPX99_03925 [Bartonella sp. 220]|uniref:hypothetical protein n=1 Tax=Bartonella sp. 220B TaxID=2967260 RepID=UPI0022A9C78D|nr:hypothetical protein [Bartonella sp. 220B]MCZ2158427.1 hypothetical protein [Bartonella sp. 220B]
MGSSSSSSDSYSSSHSSSWLFPKEDDCSVGAHSQASGAGGIVGTLMGGAAGAVGGIFSGPGGVATGFVKGAIGGGLAGAGDTLADKYNQCHTAPSCETSDYVTAAAIHGGIGAVAGAPFGPETALVGGLGGAANGLIDKYNQCHP